MDAEKPRDTVKIERSELYHFLAEALSEPPDWLAMPGAEWPLTRAAEQVATQSPAARQGLQASIEALAAVAGGSSRERQEGYENLLASSARYGLWLNEAGALSGRLLSSETWEVEAWYRKAGLAIPGAELPDNASLELEFLSFLSASEQAGSLDVEREFLKRHAGRWLPQLGKQLARSGLPVYAAVGSLLTSWLELQASAENDSIKTAGGLQAQARLLPEVSEGCTLCMACLAACPREAIRVQESRAVTRLTILSDQCDGCGRCETSCDRRALRMAKAAAPAAQDWQTLFSSPRGVCAQCGEPLASRAELNYVSEILDHPTWIELCPDCR